MTRLDCTLSHVWTVNHSFICLYTIYASVERQSLYMVASSAQLSHYEHAIINWIALIKPRCTSEQSRAVKRELQHRVSSRRSTCLEVYLGSRAHTSGTFHCTCGWR